MRLYRRAYRDGNPRQLTQRGAGTPYGLAAPPAGALPPLACGFRIAVTDAAGWTTSLFFVGPPSPAQCAAPFDPLLFRAGIHHFAPSSGIVPSWIGKTPAFVTVAPVTITGGGFSRVEKVAFGGVRAVFTVDSDGTMTAIPPIGARSGPIILTTPAGRSELGLRKPGIYMVLAATAS